MTKLNFIHLFRITQSLLLLLFLIPSNQLNYTTTHSKLDLQFAVPQLALKYRVTSAPRRQKSNCPPPPPQRPFLMSIARHWPSEGTDARSSNLSPLYMYQGRCLEFIAPTDTLKIEISRVYFLVLGMVSKSSCKMA